MNEGAFYGVFHALPIGISQPSIIKLHRDGIATVDKATLTWIAISTLEFASNDLIDSSQFAVQPFKRVCFALSWAKLAARFQRIL